MKTPSVAVSGFSEIALPSDPRSVRTSPCSNSGCSSRPFAFARPPLPDHDVIFRQPSFSTRAFADAVTFQRSITTTLRGTDTLYCRNLSSSGSDVIRTTIRPGSPVIRAVTPLSLIHI